MVEGGHLHIVDATGVDRKHRVSGFLHLAVCLRLSESWLSAPQMHLVLGLAYFQLNAAAAVAHKTSKSHLSCMSTAVNNLHLSALLCLCLLALFSRIDLCVACSETLEGAWVTQAVLAAEAPSGSSKYDMVGATLAAGLAAEMSAPTDGPVAGALDWLLSVIGMDLSPKGVCLSALLCAELGHLSTVG